MGFHRCLGAPRIQELVVNSFALDTSVGLQKAHFLHPRFAAVEAEHVLRSMVAGDLTAINGFI